MNGFLYPYKLIVKKLQAGKSGTMNVFFDVLIKKFTDALKNSLIYNSS